MRMFPKLLIRWRLLKACLWQPSSSKPESTVSLCVGEHVLEGKVKWGTHLSYRSNMKDYYLSTLNSFQISLANIFMCFSTSIEKNTSFVIETGKGVKNTL